MDERSRIEADITRLLKGIKPTRKNTFIYTCGLVGAFAAGGLVMGSIADSMVVDATVRLNRPAVLVRPAAFELPDIEVILVADGLSQTM